MSATPAALSLQRLMLSRPLPVVEQFLPVEIQPLENQSLGSWWKLAVNLSGADFYRDLRSP
jgi:hypothetical protein